MYHEGTRIQKGNKNKVQKGKKPELHFSTFLYYYTKSVDALYTPRQSGK
jgi:hypothetical protein